jgi:tellurite resistance protein
LTEASGSARAGSYEGARRKASGRSSFGVSVGVAALGLLWRVAETVWGIPKAISVVVIAIGSILSIGLVMAYAAKWALDPSTARKEMEHPVQVCFVGLGGVSLMLRGQGILPFSRTYRAGR